MKKFFSMIGKRNIVIISGIILIGLAVFINLNLRVPESVDVIDENSILENTGEDNGVLGETKLVDNQTDYFATSQINRQRSRDEAIQVLQNVVDSAEAMPDAKDEALGSIATIAVEIEKEANIETLVKAKGFTECVAIVSGDIASVIVKSAGLMPNEVAQIKEIVYEQAKVLPVNTKIIEKIQ